MHNAGTQLDGIKQFRYVTVMKYIKQAKKDCDYEAGGPKIVSPTSMAAARQKRHRDRKNKLISDMQKAFARYNQKEKK